MNPGDFRPATLLALVLLLCGCAAENAYREGNTLMAQDKATEALTRFEEANRLDPGVAQYRAAVVQTRDRLSAAQLARADTLLQQGALDAAEQAYRQLLTREGGNDRALAGLRQVDRQRRVAGWINEAEAAITKKDLDTARLRVKAVLLEWPTHDKARQLAHQIEQASAAPAQEVALAAAYRKLITIEFKDAALRSVFEVISRTSGLNFLFDKDVKTDQKTSIFLKNSTIEAAVRLTLLINQLEQRVLDANTVLIYPNTQAKQKDYQPLTVRSFYLANAEAKSVANTLKTLLKTRDVVVDDKLNLLIVRDSPEAIRLAEKLVALHDVPEPEVMLEVEILEVKRTRLLDLGIRWPEQLTLAPLATPPGGPLTIAALRGLNSASTTATVGPVNINLRKVDGDTNILANPRIRARNREKAKILIGERVPNITTTSTSTGFVAESITYVDIGLKLDVEPTVYMDGEVAIKVAMEVSNIINQVQTKSGSIAYQIGTRTAQTVLRLKDGENQVLAGLINDEDRRSANKVPGLGEVPVIGRLFGSQLDDGSKTEIVLSITPRVIRNVRQPEASLIEFESGTENSLGARTGGPAATAGAPVAPPAAAPPSRAAQAPASPSTSTQGLTSATGGSTIATAGGGTLLNAAPAASAGAVIGDLAGMAGGASLRFQGPAQLHAGEIFAVQVVMQSSQPVFSVPLVVGFDPAQLQVVTVTEGDFMRQGGVATSFESRVDPAGRIMLTGTRGGGTGASAGGVVTTITFRVVAASTPLARLQMLSAAPIGAAGQSVATQLPAPLTMNIAPPKSGAITLKPSLALSPANRPVLALTTAP